MVKQSGKFFFGDSEFILNSEEDRLDTGEQNAVALNDQMILESSKILLQTNINLECMKLK